MKSSITNQVRYEISITTKFSRPIKHEDIYNDTKSVKLKELLYYGYIIDSIGLMSDLEKYLILISKKYKAYIFQLTINSLDNYFYRYWFKSGSSYGEMGKLVFNEFNKLKLL